MTFELISNEDNRVITFRRSRGFRVNLASVERGGTTEFVNMRGSFFCTPS